LKAAVGTVVVASGGCALDAVVLEPHWIKITRPIINIDGLPAAWDGVRIAHITDLHVGRLITLDYVKEVVALLNGERPDLIVMTGDFVSRRDAITAGLAQVLGELRCTEGKFAVPGNHDYWTDMSKVSTLLADSGVDLLNNDYTILTRGDDKIALAGVDDLWEGSPDLESALGKVAAEVPRVLMCHNPDYAEQMPGHPRVDLMLCGHTHGGQVKIPCGPRPKLPIRHIKYAAGFAQGPCCGVYTSCGLGMTGIPVRLNCRPELPIITLRLAAAVA
jgi:predicted MPP superfamily phosphohydrolase